MPLTEWFTVLYEEFRPLLFWFTSISLALALVSIVVLPVMVIYMPKDYFLGAHRRRRRGFSTTWVLLIRNLCAFLLMVAGLLMLVLPGQGLLTLLAALIISDIPGKYRMERWLVLRPGILRAINWLRRKYAKPAVIAPPVGLDRSTFGKRRG